MSAFKHVIGSLGDIGIEVVKETAKIPSDALGVTIEGLGGKSSKGTPQQASSDKKSEISKQAEGALNQVDKTNDEQIKRVMARSALEQLVGYGKPDKTPTVWEKKKMEEEQKKKMAVEQKKNEEKHALPHISTKQRRGNLYGTDVKSNLEKQKNVKAE